jgi:hypothetical protein
MGWAQPTGGGSTSLDLNALQGLDGQGYRVLDALTPSEVEDPPGGSLANPRGFVVVTGDTYWVKAKAQDGLAAELIAGRLASRIGAGPRAEVVRVTAEAAGSSPELTQLVGLNVGTLDVANTINAKDVPQFVGQGNTFRADRVDAASKARVAAFQTWLGMGDAQILIDLGTGKIHSIDHGEWCGRITAGDDPQPVVTGVQGIDGDVGRKWSLVEPAVEEIESVDDAELLEAVACVPQFESWNADADRRLAIALALADRRDAVRGVMRTWTTQ